MYDKLPDELKSCPNWICWRAVPQPREDDPNHFGKIPVDPKTGLSAKSNDPSTWSDFDTAVKAAEQFRPRGGIGFMFGNSPYFGVDIDNAEPEIVDFLEGGDGLVSEFIYTLESYTELSPSGKGIHILCRGELPHGARRRGKVEMYDCGRFFTVTGDRIGEYTAISNCAEAIKPLHEKYLGSPVKSMGTAAAQRVSHSHEELPTSAEEVLSIARKARNGAKFSALYSGSTAGYNSPSEADLAFCNLLAFWTGRNEALMDEIFRQSGLMRGKWDRRLGERTYGAYVIAKACESCAEVYSPRTAAKSPVETRVDIAKNELQGEYRRYSLDDMGNAARFYDLFGEDFRYNYADKGFLYWDGKRWTADLDGRVEEAADKAVEAMSQEAEYYASEGSEELKKAFAKHISKSRSNHSKNNMLREVQHKLPVLPSSLDRDKMAFNLSNGTLSLRTGELSPHSRERLITRLSPVEFSESAECPLWTKFLDEIFAGDEELIRYVQKAVGYSMTGETTEQCVFFLFGTGSNGKSTFLEVLHSIFGEYVMNIQPETIMVKNNVGGSINSDIARLKGARFVTTVEPNEGMRLNEGLLKQLTGDDTVTARKLYGNEFEFKPEFKLWLATNHKPILRGRDEGIWRRIHMIPFMVHIPDERKDGRLKEKLEKEFPGILRWAIEGCRLWQKEGLSKPKAVLDITGEYRREMDAIAGFIEERCEVGEGLSVKSSVLYKAYSDWCEANSEFKLSNRKFSMELDRKFSRVKREDGNYFLGITPLA